MSLLPPPLRTTLTRLALSLSLSFPLHVSVELPIVQDTHPRLARHHGQAPREGKEKKCSAHAFGTSLLTFHSPLEVTPPPPFRATHGHPPLRPRNKCTDPTTTEVPRPPDTCIPSPRKSAQRTPPYVPLLTHHFLTPPCFIARTIIPQEKKQLEDDPLDNATAGPDGTATLPPPPFSLPRSKPKPRTGTRMKHLSSTTRPQQSTTRMRVRASTLYSRRSRCPLFSHPFHLLPLPFSRRRARVVLAPAPSTGFRLDARALSSFIRVCQTTRTFCSGRR
jgi:hypothetical protein